MEKDEIMAEIQEIFRDVLDNEDIGLTDDTTSADIDEWDSLSHIQLVVAIEKRFMQKFTATQIIGWKNVGAMCQDIAEKCNQ